MKKGYTTLAILCLFTAVGFAQSKIIAQADIGGTGNDDLVQLCHAADGGLLAAGYSRSNKSFYKSQNSKGNSDYWIVKSVYDKTTGKAIELWDRTIGGDSTDQLVAAVPTRDGGYILGGNSLSGKSGNKTDTCHGGYDLWLVNTDKDGKVSWDKTIGGSTNDYMICMDTTNDGGYILLYFYEPATAGSNHTALLKLDAAGNTMWRKDISGSGNSPFYLSVHSTTDGGYVFAADSAGKQVMIKTDANLNEQWKTVFASEGFNPNDDARELKDGNYMFFGTEANSLGDDGEFDYYYDYYLYLYKTNPAGKLIWSRKEYEGFDGGGKVPFEETGTGGYLYSYAVRNSYWFDYPVRKIDKDGNLQWIDSVRSIPGSTLVDIKEVRHSMYVYGYSSTAGIGADKTKKNLGNTDYWVVTVKDTSMSTSTLITSSAAATPLLPKQNVFAVYPNPAKDELHVQVAGTATILLLGRKW